MLGTILIAGATATLAGVGLAESIGHRRNLKRIPIRIHVNGTRGKSGVTRLIAAGLRAGGIRTFAKTTGTLARMILPNGSEQPVVRIGRANVIEQVGVVRMAVEQKAEALVMECMALQPALQNLCEGRLVRSTHGVITNARPDHLDVMGPTPRHVAEAMAGTVPYDGRLYTCERPLLDVFRRASRDRGSELLPIGEREIDALTVDDMAGFSYIEHPENVALALRLCTDLGIDRQTALRGMHNALPDAGVMTKCDLDICGRRLAFVNGFAANDPESTEKIWNLAIDHTPSAERKIAVLNCREDRPDRSRQLAEMTAQWQPADHHVLIGSGTKVFQQRAIALGMRPNQFSVVEGCNVEAVFHAIVEAAGQSAMVMGVGNIGGPGLPLVQMFQDRSAALAAADEAPITIPLRAVEAEPVIAVNSSLQPQPTRTLQEAA